MIYLTTVLSQYYGIQTYGRFTLWLDFTGSEKNTVLSQYYGQFNFTVMVGHFMIHRPFILL